MIRNSPSEIYHHALPFSPSSSWLRKSYSAELSREVRVVKGLPGRGSSFHTVSLDHEPTVLTSCGDIIAAGLCSGHVIILDAIAGTRVALLSGHTDWIASLAFSEDAISLVSGSDDKTIKLWDIQTGGVVKTFSGHTDPICSVSISPDHATIASGSNDMTIRLWDVETGGHRVVEGYHSIAYSISFSPTNSERWISASGDHIVRWWESGRQLGPCYEGDRVAFSSNGTHFVSWRKVVATVRASDSGDIVSKLQAPAGDCQEPVADLEHCCFSPDGKLVAGAFYDIIYVWDITSPDARLIDTFAGHTGHISSLTFSSSLISSSRDKSIKFWQIGASPGPMIAPEPGFMSQHPPRINSVILQANNGMVISSESAGVVKAWDISTGICKETFNTPAKRVLCGDAEVVDNRLIFGWCTGRELHLWDTAKGEKGALLQTVDTRSDLKTMSLRISWKGSKVFLLDHNYIRAWSTRTGEPVGEVRLSSKPLFNSLVVDGSNVRVVLEDSPVQGWKFQSAGDPVPIWGGSPPYIVENRLDFIDRTGVWSIEPSRIKDTVTGKEVFRLSGRYAKPNVVRWDSRYLVAGYDTGEVLILDFRYMIPL